MIGEVFTGQRPGYGDYACLGPNCAEDESGGYTVHLDDGEELPICPRCGIATGWVRF
jgi:hypothetical protein